MNDPDSGCPNELEFLPSGANGKRKVVPAKVGSRCLCFALSAKYKVV